MPLRRNIPEPKNDDWVLVKCPVCGEDCWESDLCRLAQRMEPDLEAACTLCALRAGAGKGGGVR